MKMAGGTYKRTKVRNRAGRARFCVCHMGWGDGVVEVLVVLGVLPLSPLWWWCWWCHRCRHCCGGSGVGGGGGGGGGAVVVVVAAVVCWWWWWLLPLPWWCWCWWWCRYRRCCGGGGCCRHGDVGGVGGAGAGGAVVVHQGGSENLKQKKGGGGVPWLCPAHCHRFPHTAGITPYRLFIHKFICDVNTLNRNWHIIVMSIWGRMCVYMQIYTLNIGICTSSPSMWSRNIWNTIIYMLNRQ